MQKLIDSILNATPLSVALLLCLVLAYVLYTVVVKKKRNGNGPSGEQEIMGALARFEAHMAWAKGEIEFIKAKVDPLVIAVATLGVTTAALKEKVEEGFDRLEEKLDRALDRFSK